MIHLSGAGFQLTEYGRIRKECDDRHDNELGLRQKWLEGTESMDVRRAQGKSDFLLSFSKLSKQKRESSNIGKTTRGDNRKQGESLQLYRRDPRRSRLLCRLVMLSVQGAHEGAWNVW